MSLPEPNQVFERFFKPYYDPDLLADRLFPDVFPDVVGIKAGLTADKVCRLTVEAREHSEKTVSVMADAALQDWAETLKVDKLDVEWVRAFDARLDAEAVEKLITESDPADFQNEFLVTCCEFGAALGTVLTQLRPELGWVYEFPYWDSWLYHSQGGLMISVFSWSIKKFSSYGIDDGYAAKLRSVAEMIASGMPPIRN